MDIRTLYSDALEILERLEQERRSTGHASPTELYWGGYVDALCRAQENLNRADLNWADEGVSRMFSKEHVQRSITRQIKACDACPLHQRRTNPVPGTGPLWTPLAIVGEAPGADEDHAGEPFVGRCGDLLFGKDGRSGPIMDVLGYARNNILIRNIVCCRPPGNRAPEPEEIHSCRRYLRWSLLNAYPKVIIALGATAVSWFVGETTTIGSVRGKTLTWETIMVVPTYHPGYLLRNPSAMDKFTEDLERVRGLLTKTMEDTTT